MGLVYDYIGVGFGPSNLALAIATDEFAQRNGREPTFCFVERKPAFSWHEGMLIDGSTMQISFLKDLATLRNPASPFTFISYLKARGRLEDFVNLKTFFPSREEYNDYLGWAAEAFAERVHYGEEVIAIEPFYSAGECVGAEVVSRGADGQVVRRRGRNLVFGIGGVAQVPEAFAGVADARIVHSSRYLGAIGGLLGDGTQPRRVAIVGGGQSAAEIFHDLTCRGNQIEATLLLRRGALKPSDDSPFVNEIFNAGFIDQVFDQGTAQRTQLLNEYRNTNYSVVDLELIEKLYQLFYQQKVRGDQRHRLFGHREVAAVATTATGVQLSVRNTQTGELEAQAFDAVILATGYCRDYHRTLLAGFADYIESDAVDRQYRLALRPDCPVQVFLQGSCEHSHGLSDTLLSVLAVRSEELVNTMFGDAARAPARESLRLAASAS
ncbi:MAG: lysine N(6)-hydroxylase/L-ornithine N(5)-oxygenase family protein [Gammaproteobacteria bacterium]|nr:lysine N(6)-hydroxylase/L-ornithine N(5)-oxygenase family protein [Gammaproteobacteria bacterium]MBU1490942.1 lysine N(6)-hydroxylase/L-ornithine N(5)-oxygenase family protein [Gammaproteobacteria bacterium]MBU2066155.1 lysine N(6)-hydroxylase/L-ornithine N(5)-oxygenase family protein [Gammaproteobacteria bacterium]MBU2138360.1 lysine N(6)-hydroxylase/L-ornithine N(5)-oxygenase family protein [Gammaproteobacteria bacterium]MBU2216590.1 lysine N(6)-hydroxylase/L-ornithine N(5)-oxygenase famil